MNRNIIAVKTVLNETVSCAYGIVVPKIIYHDLRFKK